MPISNTPRLFRIELFQIKSDVNEDITFEEKHFDGDIKKPRVKCINTAQLQL